MTPTLPFSADNGHGQTIIFKDLIHEPEGDKIIMEAHVQPDCGPPMHVHYQQDEHFHIVQGTMKYQTPGKEVAYLTQGQIGRASCRERV